jgi:hypothetical protein
VGIGWYAARRNLLTFHTVTHVYQPVHIAMKMATNQKVGSSNLSGRTISSIT